MALQPGDEAPDFELPSHRGQFEKARLADYRGRKNVVVAFHPLAFTPVCAAQMRNYEADRDKLDAADAVVFGISTDPQPSKTGWAQTLGPISFEMLSDFHPKGEVARKYGVYREQEGFTERAVFVIDKQGKVAWSKVYAIPEQPDNEEIFGVLGRLS
jgi:peroxiredoxin